MTRYNCEKLGDIVNNELKTNEYYFKFKDGSDYRIPFNCDTQFNILNNLDLCLYYKNKKIILGKILNKFCYTFDFFNINDIKEAIRNKIVEIKYLQEYNDYELDKFLYDFSD